MKKQLSYILVMVLVYLLITGCSHQVALNRDTLQKEQTVTAKLNGGDKVSGTISSVTDQTMTITDNANKTHNVQKTQVAELKGPQPFYDADGRIISEKEIAAVKTNKKLWTYTLSGGLVSAGASFFLSSMIARSSSDDIEDPIVISGTAAGTVIGGWLFSRVGKNKDRDIAVENIRLSRGSQNLSGVKEEQEKQQKIQQQLDRLKREREAQEAEIQKLREKVDEDNKQ